MCSPSSYVGWTVFDACVYQARIMAQASSSGRPARTRAAASCARMGSTANEVDEGELRAVRGATLPATPAAAAGRASASAAAVAAVAAAVAGAARRRRRRCRSRRRRRARRHPAGAEAAAAAAAPPSPPSPPAPPPPYALGQPAAPWLRMPACDSLQLSWAEAPGVAGATPASAYGMLLLEVGADAPPPAAAAAEIAALPVVQAAQPEAVRILESAATTGTLTGLLPHTAYRVRVAARNAGGWSPWSDATLASTTAARFPPAKPKLPAQVPTQHCDSIAVEVPKRRKGCSGDASLELQVQPPDSTGWHKAAATAATAADGSPLLVATDLDPYLGYSLRLVARNSMGYSATAPVKQLITADGTKLLLRPPDVRVLSSSAFRLGWRGNAGHCRPDLRWQLELKRGGGGKNGVSAINGTRAAADAGAWSVVASRIAGESFDAVGLACPEGCSFRLRAQGVEGVALVSAPSEPLATTRLPALPTAGGSTKQGAAAGGMRLRITAHLANGTALPTASFIEGKLAAALGVDVSQVRVLEKFAQREPAAVIVTLDLYSTSARPAAASAARLAGLVVRRSPLLGTLRPLEFDAAAGLEQLTPDGTVRVRPATSDGPPPAVPGAPRARAGGVSSFALLGGLVLAAAAAAALVGAAGARGCLGPRSERASGIYARAGIDEDDDDDDEPVSSRRGRPPPPPTSRSKPPPPPTRSKILDAVQDLGSPDLIGSPEVSNF